MELALTILKERVAVNGSDQIILAIEDYFRRPENRTVVAEKMREAFTDSRVRVRVFSIRLLSRLGDLHDIGLISDLLTLEELPMAERRELRKALATLSGYEE